MNDIAQGAGMKDIAHILTFCAVVFIFGVAIGAVLASWILP
jgi:hypothetical protein